MAISNNNVQNVKFLRNGNLFATREAARTALNGFELTYEKDGTAILARYGSDNAVKTLVGWVYANNSGNKSITIFDIDDAGTDAKAYVDSLVGTGITSANTATAQLEALSGNNESTSAQTSVEGAKRYADEKVRAAIDSLDVAAITAPAGAFIKSVSQADGKVSATTEDMPTVAIQTETGKPIIAVSQTKGTLAASAGTINAQYVNISDSGSLITATDVEGAIAEIATEIDAMDLTQVGDGNGKVIIAVSEQDGKVSASATSVSDLTLEGFEANAATTGAVTSADTIEAAINKLENKAAAITIGNADGSINVTTGASGTDINVNIKSSERVIKLDASDGLYTNLNVVKITESLPAEIKERYELRDSDDVKIGESIDIYKDSSIVSITYITDTGDTHYQNLEYVYIDASGNTQTEYVDISSLVLEAEFASGITVTNHVAHGVVDPDSEKNSGGTAFLTVDADGFKVNGIKQEIIDRINELDAVVTGGTTAGTATSNHVQVIVGESDGKLTGVTVTETNVADKDKLETLSGKTVTAVEMTGGTAAISAHSDGTNKITINTDGSQILMTGYAKGSDSGAVATSDSINVAIGKLENQIASKVDALDATVSGQTADGKVNVQVVQENGVLTAVTVTGTDIASDSALTSEIAARKAVDGQNGDTYAANTSSPYISGATSLNDADVKLDAQAKVNADDILKNKVKAGNGIAISGGSSTSEGTTVSAKVKNDGGLVVDSDGLHLGYIDAGMYTIE